MIQRACKRRLVEFVRGIDLDFPSEVATSDSQGCKPWWEGYSRSLGLPIGTHASAATERRRAVRRPDTPEAAMFEEAQLYAPVTRSGEGDVTVHLSDNHPGAVDPEYRARRNALAALAMEWQPGTPPPTATYTDAEHEVWRIVCGELHGLHERLACAVYLEGKQRLGLPESRIPQLVEVNELLRPLTGFQYVPAAGLVPLLEFYGSLADGVFHSTQYVRHHSVPLYTPEPDVLHEVVGHGNCLAHRPVRRALPPGRRPRLDGCRPTEALEFVSKVFWFSLEFGVVREDGEVRCYGAGPAVLLRRDPAGRAGRPAAA